MIQRLKEATRELHEQVETQNLAMQIMDHSIDLETYKLLLLQNYIAYQATENAIKQFLPEYNGKKHKQLQQDLEELGVTIESPSPVDPFECHSQAEALGAAYVVEGSALGGMLISKNLEKCRGLDSIEQHHFFNGNKDSLEDWNSYKIALEQYKFSEATENEALEKAKETFRFFQEVFNRKSLQT
ncbi:MAG: biliverdin-producing heme oxygenase [Daejeonella sp.]|uniref:biliverdin-producing heme oxygenase n=1 Tax=Daejeonella sp. TaxID=2805397 RepID=UPI003C75A12D